MSYFHETIWNGVPKFLRRVDTALKNIGINERVPYNAPLIQFSSWMGGDRDGMTLPDQTYEHELCANCFIAKKTSETIFRAHIKCDLEYDKIMLFVT